MPGHAYTADALTRSHPRAGARRGGAVGPLGVAGACLLALVLIWVVATHLPAAQLKDAVALHDFTLLNRPRVESAGNFLLHMLEPALFVIWGTAIVLVALARARPRVAVAAAAVMALAPLSSETLKPLLAHPHDSVEGVHVGPASWPSGHATAAMALVLCAVLVTPRRLRAAVAAVGALYAVAVGVALLILAWHMPSDVLGGYLMASLWMALAVAGLRAAERRWPSRTA